MTWARLFAAVRKGNCPADRPYRKAKKHCRVSGAKPGAPASYAIGVVVGALLVPALTRRLPRKTALLVLLGWFVAGNLLCALAPGYAMLMSARVVTGLSHAAFFG